MVKQRHSYILLVVLLLALMLSALLLHLFEAPFNSVSWVAHSSERYTMVDDLIESQLLKDKSKKEVITILGQPDIYSSSANAYFIYKLGDQSKFFQSRSEHLLIIFKAYKVSVVTLAYE